MLSQSSDWNGHDSIRFVRVNIEFEQGFRNAMDIAEIEEDENGIFWITTVKGLYRFNGHSALNVTEYVNQSQQNVFTTEWTSAIEITKKHIWIGTTEGLFRIRKEDFLVEKVFLGDPVTIENYRNNVISVRETGDSIVVYTMNGICFINELDGHLIDSYFTDGIDTGNRGTNYFVRSYYRDVDTNYIWIGLAEGLAKFHLPTKTYSIHSPVNFYTDRHFFYEGHWFGDTLIAGTYYYGIMEFNRSTKKFMFYSADESNVEFPKGLSNKNRIRVNIPLDDTFMFVVSETQGNGIYNRHSHIFTWLPGNRQLNFGSHFPWFDRKGYIWTAKYGRLYRTKYPASDLYNKPIKHIIDVTHIFSNKRLINQPCFTGYHDIRLEEYDRQDIGITFSLTNEYLFDSISYLISVNDNNWVALNNSNYANVGTLSPGKNIIKIQALYNNQQVASTTLLFYVNVPFYKRIWFIIACVLFSLLISFTIGWLKINSVRRVAAIKSSYEFELATLENKALRAQINPHFIFNTLTSIKHYSISKSREKTADYITSFSILIRKILENSTKNLITLKEEIETLEAYIEIERKRLGKAFVYKINCPKILLNSDVKISPMIIQPFVENAIWHGLIHKDNNRELELRFSLENDMLLCEVHDNGVGRVTSHIRKNQPSYKSGMGMQITKDRLNYLEKVLKIICYFEIEDLYYSDNKPAGTIVKIYFQQLKVKK